MPRARDSRPRHQQIAAELRDLIMRGDLTPGTLQKLKAVAAHLKNGSGDVALDGVLAEIELRVEVEIAKLSSP